MCLDRNSALQAKQVILSVLGRDCLPTKKQFSFRRAPCLPCVPTRSQKRSPEDLKKRGLARGFSDVSGKF